MGGGYGADSMHMAARAHAHAQPRTAMRTRTRTGLPSSTQSWAASIDLGGDARNGTVLTKPASKIVLERFFARLDFNLFRRKPLGPFGVVSKNALEIGTTHRAQIFALFEARLFRYFISATSLTVSTAWTINARHSALPCYWAPEAQCSYASAQEHGT